MAKSFLFIIFLFSLEKINKKAPHERNRYKTVHIAGKSIKSRRDFIKYRRDFNKYRRDFIKSRRDFNFAPGLADRDLSPNAPFARTKETKSY